MTEEQHTVARDALYEIGVISGILRALGGAEISGTHQGDGCAIEWLGKQIERLTEDATEAVNGRRPKPAN